MGDEHVRTSAGVYGKRCDPWDSLSVSSSSSSAAAAISGLVTLVVFFLPFQRAKTVRADDDRLTQSSTSLY